MKGDYDQAIADCSEAIRLDPQYVLAWWNRGECWRVKGNYKQAIADFAEVIRIDPSYYPAYWTRGESCAHGRRPGSGHCGLHGSYPAQSLLRTSLLEPRGGLVPKEGL